MGKNRAQWTRLNKYINLSHCSVKDPLLLTTSTFDFCMGNLMTKQFNSAKIIDTCVAVTFLRHASSAVCSHTDSFLLFAFAPQNCAFHACSFVHCELH